MARLAIFIDGAYLDSVCREHFGGTGIDFEKFSEAIRTIVAAATPEPVDILRTLYYNCPPYQSNPPTLDESRRYAGFRKFAEALKSLRRFEFREGRLAFRGFDQNNKPIFQQKRVDLLLGLDFALLSGRNQISHIALVAGDSDLIPAVQVAKQEGVGTWLIHGPATSFHRDLWQEADDRHEMDATFIAQCRRT